MHVVSSLLSILLIYASQQKHTSMLGKSTHLQVIPVAKHPKHSKFAITDIRVKPVNFFYCSTRASTLVSAIILLTQVSLQKFPLLYISIIPCSKAYICWQLYNLCILTTKIHCKVKVNVGTCQGTHSMKVNVPTLVITKLFIKWKIHLSHTFF